MKYNPEVHHRRSIRLKEYDYSQNGAYFVTIVAQERACLFGEVCEEKMVLNDAGRMIEQWMQECSRKFPDVLIDAHVLMPNHIHTIITNVGADLCVRPITDDDNKTQTTHSITKEKPGVWVKEKGKYVANLGVPMKKLGEHTGSPLHWVVQWFKTMTTNAYIQGVKNQNWPCFPKKLWQRNYYERVIRDENELHEIREYMDQNPLKWEFDKENPKVAS